MSSLTAPGKLLSRSTPKLLGFSRHVGFRKKLAHTCVDGTRPLEGGRGVPILGLAQKPMRCLSMRSSCERITTPCRSNGTSACEWETITSSLDNADDPATRLV